MMAYCILIYVSTLKYKLRQAYHELDGIFTDGEAWFLFRVTAYLETIGWTLLIVGILCSVYKWPGNDWILAVAGSIHGIFYLAYLFIVLFGHRSMKWGVGRFLFAELISVVPYGALVFEKWVARRRRLGKK